DNTTVLPAGTHKVVASQAASRFAVSKSLRLVSLILFLIAGLSVWYLSYRYAGDEPKRTLVPFTPSALKTEQITNSGNVVSAAISPDGKQVAFVLENSGQQSLWLRQLATAVDVQIISPGYVVYRRMCFSHGGDYIYFVRHDEGQVDDLFRIPAIGGSSAKVNPQVSGSILPTVNDSPVALSPLAFI